MNSDSFRQWYAFPQLYRYRVPFAITGDKITFYLSNTKGESAFEVGIGEVEQDSVTGLWCAALADGYSVYNADIDTCLIDVVDIHVSYESEMGVVHL